MSVKLSSLLLVAVIGGPTYAGSPLSAEPPEGTPPPEEGPVEEPPTEPSPPPDTPPERPDLTPSSEAPPPPPPRRDPPSPYEAGKVRVGVGGGLIAASELNVGFAVSLGYFVVDNVEVGADTAVSFGSAAFAAMLGPTARVLFPINEVVHPYVGVFYRHWFFDASVADDVDTLGARAGIAVRTGATFFQLGLVYEFIVSECSGDACSDLYPELGVSVVF